MRFIRTVINRGRVCLAAMLVASTAAAASAQSADVGRPSPVLSNEIGGRIAPRDVGDARLTRHFYAFNGLEGDLLVTAESTDFNGDVDVFTASTLRPLLKITTFGGPTPTRVTKSVYLRRGEPLILRVEGRAVAEADAQYRIRLEGAFGPAAGALAQAGEPATPDPSEAASAARTGRRTTATGARIAEPVTEPVAQPETSAEASANAPPESAATPAASEPARTRRGRNSRTTPRTNTRRTRPTARETAEAEADKARAGEASEADKASETDKSAESGEAAVPAPRSPRTRNTRRGERSAAARTRQAEEARADEDKSGAVVDGNNTTAPAAEPTPEPGTRLVIVTKDGETIERDMRTVRRVTVERGQIVVVGTDGRVTRQPMSNVTRVTIEP